MSAVTRRRMEDADLRVDRLGLRNNPGSADDFFTGTSPESARRVRSFSVDNH